MSANPYAPPEANVADVAPANPTNEPPFFAVSTTKLVVMSLCTLTVYQIFWFYQQWVRIKRRNESSIVPAARAIFAVFFCYSLFAEVKKVGRQFGVPGEPQVGALAAGWIVLSLMWKLPDPYWWIAMGAILFAVPMQAYANAINSTLAPQHDRNARFSAWNWLAIVLGGLMLVLALLGTFFPE